MGGGVGYRLRRRRAGGRKEGRVSMVVSKVAVRAKKLTSPGGAPSMKAEMAATLSDAMTGWEN